jgi:protein MYSM1
MQTPPALTLHALCTSRPQAWSEEEEAAFARGLEEHGRDWRSVAAGIGTRDSRAVASHAQKHFIKLCLSGEAQAGVVACVGVS